jgi:putative membrane protein insertion efficiency factor
MKKILLFLIRIYRNYISPIRRPCCRFVPTCSAYALEAVERYGALRGGLMALWRVLRCNPFCKGGFDPVP